MGPGDAHGIGAGARVVSHLGPLPFPPPDGSGRVYGYFVEWDDLPTIPVFVLGTRIDAVEAN